MQDLGLLCEDILVGLDDLLCDRVPYRCTLCGSAAPTMWGIWPVLRPGVYVGRSYRLCRRCAPGRVPVYAWPDVVLKGLCPDGD